MRNVGYNRAWETIRNKQQGSRAAMELMTEGCDEKSQLEWIPEDILIALFGKCSRFEGEDLSKLNLSSANLMGAHLRDANLRDANLRDANLSGADLFMTDLRGANLKGTDLSDADLSGADLRFADLSDTDLRDTKLSRAKLKRAIYNKATKLPKNFDPNQEQMLLIAPGVNFSGADLSRIDFKLADFQGINLTNANLEGSDLQFVQNLTPEQVKAAKNWEKAIYSDEFRKKLGL